MEIFKTAKSPLISWLAKQQRALGSCELHNKKSSIKSHEIDESRKLIG